MTGSGAPPRSAGDLRFGCGLAATALLAAVGTLLAWAVVPALLPGWQASVVASGSMAPAIREGDVVATQTPSDGAVPPGSVILFDTGSGPTLHRVVDITDAGYVTKGDANADVDGTEVSRDGVRGIGAVLVPWVGMPHRWLDTGRWILVGSVALAAAITMYASRWASDPSLDPWRGPRRAVERGHRRPLRLTGPAMPSTRLLPAEIRSEILEHARRPA